MNGPLDHTEPHDGPPGRPGGDPDRTAAGWLGGAGLGRDDPAFTTGTAADLLGVTQAFLRQLGVSGLLDPHRSGGGHRRYSRHELDLAARARNLVDEGLSLDAACRIVVLEADLARRDRELTEARAQISDLRRRLDTSPATAPAADPPAERP
jgi:MerR family transcriptional regulator/heat shock protein HspR